MAAVPIRRDLELQLFKGNTVVVANRALVSLTEYIIK